jgi:hypothetical protein
MKNVINFFKKSYANDRTAFYAEIVETTLFDPATKIFVPLYLIGSILAVFSTYRRGSSAIVLCAWFTVMNSWAFLQLFVL